LDPAPADLAYGSLELAALEYRARRGEIILLYEDETILWRFALPRAGWWRTAQRARIPTRPLSQSQIKREEALKRHAWLQYRSWSRITSGVLLSVIGAVQYGTSKVFYPTLSRCLERKNRLPSAAYLTASRSFRGGLAHGTGSRRASRSPRLARFCDQGLRAD
jgi:hypothetical protein